MAYNNYFPIGYQQAPIPQYYGQNVPNMGDYGRTQVNPQPAQNVSQNGIIWVTGEAGGRGYPIAPGQTVQLWDSEAPVIYLKSADISGMPSMKILDYTVRDETKKNELPIAADSKMDTSRFVTRDELDERLAQLIQRDTAGKAGNVNG